MPALWNTGIVCFLNEKNHILQGNFFVFPFPIKIHLNIIVQSHSIVDYSDLLKKQFMSEKLGKFKCCICEHWKRIQRKRDASEAADVHLGSISPLQSASGERGFSG